MWWELALNPKVVLAYYSHPPLLHGVEVLSVHLNRDGPTLELLIEMPCFPDKPSKRWPIEANVAQMTLRFIDLRELSLSGWSTTNTGALLIESDAGMVRFRFDCPSTSLYGIAGFFDITTVTGYIKSGA